MDDLKRWEGMELNCLVCIFERLSLHDLTLTVPFVCKSWHRASLDPLCWRVLDFQSIDSAPWSKFVERFEKRYSLSSFLFSGFLRLLVARSCGLTIDLRFPLLHKVAIEDLLYASDECPRLRALVMPDLTPEDELQIPQLVRKWRELERLELELKPSCFVEMMREIMRSCEKFAGLRISGEIHKLDARAIVECAPRIKYLDLSRSYLRREELTVIVKGCREIEVLKVNWCVGFDVDEEVMEIASSISVFEHEGSNLCDWYLYNI